MDKIIFYDDDGEPIEFYVLEQTRLTGINYLLVTDCEEGDGDALILKDMSQPEEEESVYQIVSDDEEMATVAEVFEEMLEDVEFVTED